MLLQRLKEYADTRMALPPTLYSETAVRYIIELDMSGRLLNPKPTDTADSSKSSEKRGARRPVPQVVRSSGVKPLLLADKADYTLEFVSDQSKSQRVARCHQAYLDLVQRCAKATQEPTVQAVLAFLSNDPLTQLDLSTDFDPGALITFRVDGIFPIDLTSVQAFWANEHTQAVEKSTVMQCLVCGQERPVLERLQGKVKGVPGGQTSGTSIISANAGAFESYGLQASFIAPTCADCGERFTRALNELLSSKHNRVILNDTAFLFWTREKVEFDFGGALTQPTTEQMQYLFEAVQYGKHEPDVDETAFYATVLSASGGRTVVRDWIDTTVGEAKRRLARWFQDQHIINERGEEPRPLGIYGLAGATVRELRDVPSPTVRALIRAALVGTPLPTALLSEAVRRSRAEQTVTRQRAALIKLVFLSQPSDTDRQENAMVELDPNHPSIAYHCGRLLTVLAEIQHNAIGKAAIIDRFYGSASSAPGSVFPRLLRGAQPHFAKLERDQPNAAAALHRRLEEVMSSIDHFPTTLTLTEQGLFAIGFYHQKAHDRAQMIAASERKKAQKATGSSTQVHEEPVVP